jgi:hypothetical protein
MAKIKKIKEIPVRIKEIEKHEDKSDLEEEVVHEEVEKLAEVVNSGGKEVVRQDEMTGGLKSSGVSGGVKQTAQTSREVDINSTGSFRGYTPRRDTSESKYDPSIRRETPVHFRDGAGVRAQQDFGFANAGGEGQSLRRNVIEQGERQKYEMEKAKKRVWAGE